VGETFRLTLGLDLVHVPFNGSGPAIASMIAGHTPIGFTSAATAAPQVKDGRLRALAVMSKTRLPVLPQVPTMTEAGHGDIECDDWLALLVPAGTPKETTARLYREIVNILAMPAMQEQLAALGFQPVGITPEEFAATFIPGTISRA
jgi:tripartite-type tricarboxylate transporter receptor subunit TctC